MIKKFLLAFFLFYFCALQAQINVPYWLNQGREKIIDNDNYSAIESFNVVIRHYPDVSEAFFLRAIAKYNLADYRGAINDLTAAIEISPVYSEHFLYRGQARERIYDYAGSREDYLKAVELKPYSVDGYLCLGVNSLIMKNYDQALYELNEVLARDPKNSYAWLYIAVSKQYKGLNEEAMKDFDKAIKFDPKNSDAYIRRGKNLADMKKYKEAIADFNQSLMLSPNNSFAYFNRAIARCELEEYNGAMNDFNRVISIDPDNDISYYNRAELKSKQGDFKGAIEDYNKVIELNPNNVYTYFNRGITWYQLKNYRKSIEDYSKAIELNPDFAVAYYNRALAKKLINDQKGAYRDYEMAAKLDASSDSLKKAGKIDSLGLARITEFRADFSDGNVVKANDNTFNLFQIYKYYFVASDSLKIKGNDAYHIIQKWHNPLDSAYKAVMSCNDYAIDDDTAKIFISKILKLENNSDSAEYLLLLKSVLMAQLQLFDRAADENNFLIKSKKLTAEALFHKANVEFLKMLYLSSIDDFYSNITIIGDKKNALEQQKPQFDFSQAISYYKESLKLQPRNKYAFYNLGNALNESEEFQQAIEVYNKAIQIDPKFGVAYFNRGLTQIRMGDKLTGCADLSKAGELGIIKAYEAIRKVCN